MVNVGEGDAIDACNFVTKPTDTEYCETHSRGLRNYSYNIITYSTQQINLQ